LESLCEHAEAEGVSFNTFITALLAGAIGYPVEQDQKGDDQ
jgi:hypothetical protein